MIVERSSAPRGLKVSARFVGHTAMAVSHECNSPSAVSTKVVICCRTNRCIKTSPSDSAKRIVRLYATVSQAHVADPVPHILSLYGEERVGEKREAKKTAKKSTMSHFLSQTEENIARYSCFRLARHNLKPSHKRDCMSTGNNGCTFGYC